jgi:putative methylase
MKISIRKHELAIRLQGLHQHPDAKVSLEQYTIPADLAAEILFHACYSFGDIENKSVVDLGTGTGRLAIGAVILGADYTVGIDIDNGAVKIAAHECKESNVDWVIGDISVLRGEFDTVLMNPPFGTKRPHADVRFLETALNLGNVIYSIHKTATQEFIGSWLRDHSADYQIIMNTKMEIGHQFHFHRKTKYAVEVQVYRIVPTKT